MLAKPVNDNREKSHSVGVKRTRLGEEGGEKKRYWRRRYGNVIGTPRGHAKNGEDGKQHSIDDRALRSPRGKESKVILRWSDFLALEAVLFLPVFP